MRTFVRSSLVVMAAFILSLMFGYLLLSSLVDTPDMTAAKQLYNSVKIGMRWGDKLEGIMNRWYQADDVSSGFTDAWQWRPHPDVLRLEAHQGNTPDQGNGDSLTEWQYEVRHGGIEICVGCQDNRVVAKCLYARRPLWSFRFRECKAWLAHIVGLE